MTMVDVIMAVIIVSPFAAAVWVFWKSCQPRDYYDPQHPDNWGQ